MRLRAPLLVFAFMAPADASAQSAPPEPYVVEGACPFECCTYREWTARKSFPAYAAEGDTAKIAFSVAEGERFQAQTGNVHITHLGLVEVRGALHQYGYDSGGRRFEPGDTLYVLNYLGEGFYNVWYRGEVFDAARYWQAVEEVTAENEQEVRAVVLREPSPEWWVQIMNGAGETGWIYMKEASVDGADACS